MSPMSPIQQPFSEISCCHYDFCRGPAKMPDLDSRSMLDQAIVGLVPMDGRQSSRVDLESMQRRPHASKRTCSRCKIRQKLTCINMPPPSDDLVKASGSGSIDEGPICAEVDQVVNGPTNKKTSCKWHRLDANSHQRQSLHAA